MPWRLYLTPRLDRYVDFHRSSLIAWRQEPKAERQDACTVWLRVVREGRAGSDPLPAGQETILVPSFATWIGGELVDDYLDQSAARRRRGATRLGGVKQDRPHCSNRTGPRAWTERATVTVPRHRSAGTAPAIGDARAALVRQGGAGPGARTDLLREAAVYDIVRDRCPATAARLPRDVRWNADADELEMEAAPAERPRGRA